MIHATCRLTTKNRDQLRNPTLGDRVWATCTFLCSNSCLRLWACWLVAVVWTFFRRFCCFRDCLQALSDSFELVGAAEISLSIYLSIAKTEPWAYASHSTTKRRLNRSSRFCRARMVTDGHVRRSLDVKKTGWQSALYVLFMRCVLNVKRCAILQWGVYAYAGGCSSPFLRPWARRWVNHWSLWRMASATTDLRLPSEPHGITAPWPVPNCTAWWQSIHKVKWRQKICGHRTFSILWVQLGIMCGVNG